MAPLFLNTLWGLAVHNTTNATTIHGLTPYRPQMFNIPPPFIPPHSHRPSHDDSSPSTDPAVGGTDSFTSAVSIALILYVSLCLAVAFHVINCWNSHKRPYPRLGKWMFQLTGVFLLLFCTLPLVVLHGGLQILVRAFLRCAGVSAAMGSSVSSADATHAISFTPSPYSASTVTSATEQSDVERQQHNGNNHASGGIFRRALINYIGLHPLCQGTPSWAERNHAWNLRQRPGGEREPRRSARWERQRNEEIAQLEADLTPLPAYDGAVLPPYTYESYGPFTVRPLSIRQGELRRGFQGDFVRQNVVCDGDIADAAYTDREVRSPPPSYRSPRRAPGGPLSLC